MVMLIQSQVESLILYTIWGRSANKTLAPAVTLLLAYFYVRLYVCLYS
jgi:hypothetical protein